jgi:hypothetical protein
MENKTFTLKTNKCIKPWLLDDFLLAQAMQFSENLLHPQCSVKTARIATLADAM